jgi:cell division protein FtsQ
LCRIGAVGFLALTLVHGLEAGGHLKDPRSPLYGLSGQVAGYFGYAAQDIAIAGLEHQTAESVLAMINVQPDSSLFFFDAARARRMLENVDWIESASLRRVHPNRLEIEIVERQPFAVWQRDGSHYVIDRNGTALSTLDAARYRTLAMVTGEGANDAVFDLVNHLEENPDVKLRLSAAARVGQRRWNLYLKDGVKVLLPEDNVGDAFARLGELQRHTGVMDKAVRSIDLRMAGTVAIAVERDGDDSGRPLKVSSR